MGLELRHIEIGGFLPAGGDSLGYHQLAVLDAVPGDKPVERESWENIYFFRSWNRLGKLVGGFMPLPSPPP